jgi:hypothetical protein
VTDIDKALVPLESIPLEQLANKASLLTLIRVTCSCQWDVVDAVGIENTETGRVPVKTIGKSVLNSRNRQLIGGDGSLRNGFIWNLLTTKSLIDSGSSNSLIDGFRVHWSGKESIMKVSSYMGKGQLNPT